MEQTGLKTVGDNDDNDGAQVAAMVFECCRV